MIYPVHLHTMIKVFIFVSLFSIASSVCTDLAPTACLAISKRMQGMCNDPCIALICSETCNNCPLRCYNCKDTLNPEDCKATVQCDNIDEVCIAVQRLTPDYIPLFSSGCEKRDVCVKVFGNINTKRSLTSNPLYPRALTLKGGCCDVDKCNIHDPENNPTEAPGYVRTTIPSDINPTYASSDINCTGDDLDPVICGDLQIAVPNMCSRNCIAQKLCQSTCKTCLKCFKCDAAVSLDSCQTTSVCKVNQKCVHIETLETDFVPRYRMGCMDDAICRKFFGHGKTLLGKRQTLRGDCCGDSLCNNQTTTT